MFSPLHFYFHTKCSLIIPINCLFFPTCALKLLISIKFSAYHFISSQNLFFSSNVHLVWSTYICINFGAFFVSQAQYYDLSHRCITFSVTSFTCLICNKGNHSWPLPYSLSRITNISLYVLSLPALFVLFALLSPTMSKFTAV